MVSNFWSFSLMDERQKSRYFDPDLISDSSKYTELTNLVIKKHFSDAKPFTVFWHKLPIESFILINNMRNFSCSFSTLSSSNSSNIQLKAKNYYYFTLFLNFNLDEIFFPVDAYVYQQNAHKVYNLVFTSVYYQRWLSVSCAYVDEQLYSISNIYKSFVWVEREIQELTNTYFIGLVDNRRLLTDYTMYQLNSAVYRTNSYDLVTQNLYY